MTAEAVGHGNGVLAHRGPWSEADYLALLEQQAQRVELVEGERIEIADLGVAIEVDALLRRR